ncbi:unnamed protein product [Spirodela intermedia]|uniref:Hexosyltransferase n=1 Tax=Spirodela intermedia TaxID=51605 RepID=A0A7I8ICV1_SPIIN|nr:unnamed protein product [Spirodela intermedia]CAA6655647.1 unnamed protein product [Spirodela intermedia]
MTLDTTYLRGSVAGVLSVLQHASCPENIVFHFLASSPRRLRTVVLATFPYLSLRMYRFDTALVRGKISSSSAGSSISTPTSSWWTTSPSCGGSSWAPTSWGRRSTATPISPPTSPTASGLLQGVRGAAPPALLLQLGVMVIDLERWRAGRYTGRLEEWMRVQKRRARIYELGSLPPFLLVFAGDVKPVEHRWNQHGLGGDNLEGLCRDLHPGR